jgi:hypothetical protein
MRASPEEAAAAIAALTGQLTIRALLTYPWV